MSATTTIEFTVTEPAFRAWLAAKKPLQRVGRRADCYECPLATFISEHLPDWVRTVNVDHDAMYALDGRADCDVDVVWEQTTPAWAARFIHNVDGHDAVRITALTALRKLDRAVEQLREEYPYFYQRLLEERAAATA